MNSSIILFRSYSNASRWINISRIQILFSLVKIQIPDILVIIQNWDSSQNAWAYEERYNQHNVWNITKVLRSTLKAVFCLVPTVTVCNLLVHGTRWQLFVLSPMYCMQLAQVAIVYRSVMHSQLSQVTRNKLYVGVQFVVYIHI